MGGVRHQRMVLPAEQVDAVAFARESWQGESGPAHSSAHRVEDDSPVPDPVHVLAKACLSGIGRIGVDVLARCLLPGGKSAAVMMSFLSDLRKTLQLYEGPDVAAPPGRQLTSAMGRDRGADACLDVQPIIEGRAEARTRSSPGPRGGVEGAGSQALDPLPAGPGPPRLARPSDHRPPTRLDIVPLKDDAHGPRHGLGRSARSPARPRGSR